MQLLFIYNSPLTLNSTGEYVQNLLSLKYSYYYLSDQNRKTVSTVSNFDVFRNSDPSQLCISLYK